MHAAGCFCEFYKIVELVLIYQLGHVLLVDFRESKYIMFSCEFYCVSVYLKFSSIVNRFAYGVLRRFLPEEKVESVQGLTLTADGKGAVFDVAEEDLDTFLDGTVFTVES